MTIPVDGDSSAAAADSSGSKPCASGPDISSRSGTPLAAADCCSCFSLGTCLQTHRHAQNTRALSGDTINSSKVQLQCCRLGTHCGRSWPGSSCWHIRDIVTTVVKPSHMHHTSQPAPGTHPGLLCCSDSAYVPLPTPSSTHTLSKIPALCLYQERTVSPPCAPLTCHLLPQ